MKDKRISINQKEFLSRKEKKKKKDYRYLPSNRKIILQSLKLNKKRKQKMVTLQTHKNNWILLRLSAYKIWNMRENLYITLTFFFFTFSFLLSYQMW